MLNGELWAETFPVQDSSVLSAFAAADGLVVRAPHAAAAAPGERVSVLRLDGG